MVVPLKKYVRMDMSKESYYLQGASSCCFQFNLHPDSKFRRLWVSEEGRCWEILRREENELMSTGRIRLGASQMMDDQVPYSMLWDFLSSVPLSASSKDSVVRHLLSYAHSVLDCNGFHKYLNITLRLDIYQHCLEDMEYNRKAEELEQEEEEEEECCSICLDDMVKGCNVTRLPCSHLFHGACISQWLWIISSTCPRCRSQVPLITTQTPSSSRNSFFCSFGISSCPMSLNTSLSHYI